MKINFVVFGGTGDLTKRKLAPALNKISEKNKIKIRLIGIGRTEYVDKTYEKHLSLNKKNKNLNIKYYRGDITKKETMMGLFDYVNEESADQTIYYLATSFKFYEPIFELLASKKHKDMKIMIEKPFGSDFESWYSMNKKMRDRFTREQVYRVDHYVAKETIDNILLLRLSNPFFENTWNSNFVDTIKIVSKEDLFVDSRLNYYDDAGAIRDMIQNHLLQTLSFVLMEPPKSLDADDLRDMKTNAIKKLEFIDVKIGQYEGYKEAVRKELGKNTKTETYAKTQLKSKAKRWKSTKIILETGKAMHKKEAYIELLYKKEPCHIYCDFNTTPNKLRIDIQPQQNISLTMNTKLPGTSPDIASVNMTFCPTCGYDGDTPKGYETLINECIKGEKKVFIRASELDASWKLTDKIREKTRKQKITKYDKGSKEIM